MTDIEKTKSAPSKSTTKQGKGEAKTQDDKKVSTTASNAKSTAQVAKSNDDNKKTNKTSAPKKDVKVVAPKKEQVEITTVIETVAEIKDSSAEGVNFAIAANDVPVQKKIYERKVDSLGRSYATGKRKTAIAKLWLQKGKGAIIVNNKPLIKYFPRLLDQFVVKQPLIVLHKLGEFDIKISVAGGGISAHAQSIRHAMAQALSLFDPNYRPQLREEGFLTRDSRIVERKKPGKRKARKKEQYSKR